MVVSLASGGLATTMCNAIPINGFEQVSVSVYGSLAAVNNNTETSCDLPASTQWYSLISSTKQVIVATTCNPGTSSSPSITLFSGYNCGAAKCQAKSTPDPSCTVPGISAERISWTATPGNYWLAVSTVGGDPGKKKPFLPDRR